MLERLVATHDVRLCTGPDGTTAARRHLTIGERTDGGVALSGELDIHTSGHLAAHLAELGSAGDLVLLTCDLAFADLSGCRALVRAAERLAPGRRMVLPDASPQLVRVLKLCGWLPHERVVLA